MATAAAPEESAPAPKKGKKKLFILIGVAVLVLGLAGAGALFYVKSKQAAAEAEAEAEDGAPAKSKAAAHAKRDPKAVPIFVPLDPFTVNLSDREAERYAQIGISLELEDAKAGDQVKAYMPVIRNNILMVLSHKSSAELLERDGKTKLAQEVLRETLRGLGIDPPEPEAKAGDEDKPRKKSKKAPEEAAPVKAVHFSNFIIQ